MIWATFEPMTMDECFDFCEASYAFAMEWHDGQWSEIYSFFGPLHDLRYEPGLLFNGYESLSYQGREYYWKWLEYYGYEDEMNRLIEEEDEE
jgi:hypothetical protein